MKKTLKTVLSLAFALLLVFQLAGNMDAQAAGAFNITINGGTADDVVIKAGDTLLADASVSVAQANGITISPAEGVYYVESVKIANVDMSDKLIATETNQVRFTSEYISSLTLGSSVNFELTLGKLTVGDIANISYDPGIATVYSTLVDSASSTLKNNPFKVPDITSYARTEALMQGFEFAGWNLVYANGAEREGIKVGDNVAPYMDFTLVAQWNEVTSIIVNPKAQSKEYDGTADLVNTGSDPSHFEFAVYKGGVEQQYENYSVSGGSIVRAGDNKDKAEVNTTPYITKASGVTVTEKASGKVIDSKYVFYADGTFDIYPRYVEIKVNDTTTDYTGDKLYPSGVTVSEDTPLAAGQSVDPASVEYDRFSVRVSSETFNIKSLIIRDAANNDVTKNYDIHKESGVLKITPIKISIAPADNTVAYDGKSHTITYKVTAGTLGKNDEVTLTTQISGATNAGEYKNIKITDVKIYNTLVERDSTNCYEITLDKDSSATLTITKHYLMIRPVSKTTIYAGPTTSLTADSYEIVDGSLLDGHKIVEPLRYEGTINVVADGVGVTKYSNIDVSSINIVDAEGNNVTNLYTIATDRGTLRIEPIDIVIIAGSNSASYSGNAITPDPAYTVVGNLLSNHQLVDVVVKGSQTYVGSSETYIESYDIVDKSNNISVKGNNYYRVTLNKGTLTVTDNPNLPQPETITVEVKSLSKTYDGKPLSLSATDYTVTDTKGVVAAGGYELKVTVDTTTSITNAGSTNVGAPTVEVYKNGVKVTDHPFMIETKGGTLTVNKLVVTLTAASASKKYDGKALTCAKLADGGATVGNASGKLVDGHTLNKNDIVYQGSQTNVGSSANKIISATIRDANGNSVNHNYEIVRIDGVLTVTSAAGTGTGTVAGGAASGDTSNIGLWIAIMAVLAVAAAAVVFIFFKKKKADR